MRPLKPIVDFHGTEIKIGDRYFYGSPPTIGFVAAIKVKTITINTDYGFMNCKSPDKGICIDRVPGQGESTFTVRWTEWVITDDYYRNECVQNKRVFYEKVEADEFYKEKKKRSDSVSLTMTSSRILEEHND
jgi:hypothetical protein